MKVINTVKAPKAIGPYSQAILTNDNFLYVSGQLGLNPQTMILEDNIELQTRRVFENIDEILKEANFDRNDIIKTMVLIDNMADFDVINQIYGEYFGNHKPARSAFEVSKLPKNGLIEIEVIAKK
ncbi:RidA family protein [Spiroplasma cantharicola]|uniref:2-iminobutanoate/2-iminopropanoate deaminase n=1 Tax=Spiroplasma cantharicola TaxID=362837 RepID=A0A0M4K0V0_9MOLU|nr:RidA family protein [Spiroplasma cantharicola]ALD66125.1 2-iminobutanoate/2-iminopropanoate deaminase [Spiroplasma cantharicola]